MIEEEIKKELKSKNILQNVFVVLGKNIKSTGGFPGQVEPLANLLGSNKFYIRVQSTLKSPGQEDAKLAHNYYYRTIAGNGKDYKCATFSEYWKEILIYFGTYPLTQTGAGNLPTFNPGIEKDIKHLLINGTQ